MPSIEKSTIGKTIAALVGGGVSVVGDVVLGGDVAVVTMCDASRF